MAIAAIESDVVDMVFVRERNRLRDRMTRPMRVARHAARDEHQCQRHQSRRDRRRLEQQSEASTENLRHKLLATIRTTIIRDPGVTPPTRWRWTHRPRSILPHLKRVILLMSLAMHGSRCSNPP